MHQPITETDIPAYQPPPGKLTRLRRALTKLIIAALFLWLAAIGLISWQQEKLLFHPEPLPASTKFNLPYTSEVYIDVDGARLHALYLRQPPGKSRGILLFLHGNAGNLETWFVNPEFWLTTDYDVLMPDYRGYGKSTGRITSEAQLNDDVLRVWNSVATQYQNKKKVIYGRSLGTALATTLATKVPADLLILVSPFTNMDAMVDTYYPWVPHALLRYPLDTAATLPKVHSNILLIHGTADTLINITHSQQLLRLNPRAHLVAITGAGHGDIHNFPQYQDTLRETLKAL